MDVRHRIGEAQSQIPFTTRTEARTGEQRNPGLVEQVIGEPVRGLPERRDVGEGVERTARHLAPHAGDGVQPGDQHVAPPPVRRHHRRDLILRPGQRLDARVLRERRRATHGVRQEQVQPVGQRLRHNPVSQSPAGHRVCFREAVADDHALAHPRQRRDARHGHVVERQPRVDFVGEHPEVVSLRGLGDVLQHRHGHHAAGRIAGRVQHDHARALADQPVERIQVEGKIVLFAQRDGHRHTSGHADHRRIGGEAGVGIEHLVARIHQRGQGRVEVVDLSGGASIRYGDVSGNAVEMAWNPVTEELAVGTSSGNLYIFEPLEAPIPVDVTGPTIAVNHPTDGSSTNDPSLTTTGRVTDATGVAGFTVNGTPVSLNASGDFSHTMTLVEGSNIITYWAQDSASGGNESTTTRSVTLVVDTIPPVISNSAVAPSLGTAGTVFAIQTDVVDGDTGVGSVTAMGAGATERSARTSKPSSIRPSIKLEGGAEMASRIKGIVSAGIPAIGHLGLTPQSASALGGFRLQGKSALQAKKIIDDAKALEEAGAFAILLELVPDRLCKLITERAENCIIMSLGAGPDAHGQLLIYHDMFGLYPKFKPQMAKVFGNAGEVIQNGLTQYVKEVKDTTFPAKENYFGMKDDEYDELMGLLD